MPISSRGVTAAGLAFAVVATVAVTSTLNAGAAQIAETTTTAVEPLAAPPPALPGAAKADAARVSAGARALLLPLAVTPRRAPKGKLPAGGAPLRRSTVSADGATALGVAPEPPSELAVAPPRIVNYFYSSASQTSDSDGVYGHLTIAKPTLANEDFHSLAEIAAQSADGAHIVEVGWNVDREVNGDDAPHLFVYHWVDRKESCYNGCGFKQYSATIKPGSVLPAGATKRFTIQHFGAGWWIGYDTEWIGHFPDSLWDGRFTRTGLTQWFGEVAASSLAPCTDMGNGLPVEETTAASFNRIGFYDGPVARIATGATSPHYAVKSLGSNSFRFGGPGAC